MLITESRLRQIIRDEMISIKNSKKIREAIVDIPSEKLSDIFDDEGKLHREVANTIRDAITKTQNWLSKTYNLRISEIFVVGAAVTFQYAPESDIDISVVIPNITKEQLKAVDDWMSVNLDYPNWSVNGSSRPYQFKPMANNNNYKHVDAAYDPIGQKWVKKPEFHKSKEEFEKRVANPESQERDLYAKVERNIKPSLQRLYLALLSDEQLKESLSPNLEELFISAYKRYEVIKNLRSKSYQQEPEGLISQNWGRGNLIYKFLDREGYTDVYSMIKTAIKSKFEKVDQKFIEDLKEKLEKVITDEEGYQVATS